MVAELELWGGIEASIVRLHDAYRDQCLETGHHGRAGDLEAVARLGIRTLRYPFLWERCAPRRANSFEWDWCDIQASKMRRLGLRPIAGLLHHGSGPRYTRLADPEFPSLFANYAGAVAARYPWISQWTPINEPLTTARFSGLYGVWYPHARDEALFWAMFLNQIEAIKLAMAAIRNVRSDAELVQTEDLGHILSTPNCSGEAEFQNQRRWLTWDLLCAKVTKDHPLWQRIAGHGHRDRLLRIADAPCIPDTIGINHYLTSNRFLDGRGAALSTYTDVEAVRVHTAPPSLFDLLHAAWERYRTPLAVTEVHNGSTRDEQLRWLLGAWNAAVGLGKVGVSVKAVTIWALFGCVDRASLLTRRESKYEVGAFDVRGGNRRETALAALARNLCAAAPLPSPLKDIAAGKGWWDRDIRFNRTPYGPAVTAAEASQARPILIIGQSGLGNEIRVTAKLRGLSAQSIVPPLADLAAPDRIGAIIRRIQPWAVVNASTYSGIDRSERNPALCFAVNAEGASAIAKSCARLEIPCVTCSSDLIFEGRQGHLYRESDTPAPLNVYGRSKAEAERKILAYGGRQLIVRSGPFFGGKERRGLMSRAVTQFASGTPAMLPDDRIFTPSYLPDIAGIVLDLLIDGELGIWHLSNGEPVSWRGLGIKVCDAVRACRDHVLARPTGLGAKWPVHTPLASERAVLLPSLDDAVARYASELATTTLGDSREAAT